jgi:diacylglycerol kinase family enzyme
MFAIVGLLVALILNRSEIEMNVLGLRGTTYTKVNDTTIVNIFKATLLNKTNQDHELTLSVLSNNATLEAVGGPIHIEKGKRVERQLLIKMFTKDIRSSITPVTIGLSMDGELIEEDEVNFSGPGF